MKKASEVTSLLGSGLPVPLARNPLVWDLRLSAMANMQEIEYRMHEHTQRLPVGCEFDEAAIMVPTWEVRDRLFTELEMAGWNIFNQAADLVHTSPFGTRYTVEYTFFQHPNKKYRFEVMMLGRPALDGEAGFSPLHQALWTPSGKTPTWESSAELPVAHLSFKPTMPKHSALLKGEELLSQRQRSYNRVIDHLRTYSYIHAQTCQSTYGVFSYWLYQDETRQLYVKPRINTRDAS